MGETPHKAPGDWCCCEGAVPSGQCQEARYDVGFSARELNPRIMSLPG